MCSTPVGIRSGFIRRFRQHRPGRGHVLNARRHKKWFHFCPKFLQSRMYDRCSTPVGIRSGFITKASRQIFCKFPCSTPVGIRSGFIILLDRIQVYRSWCSTPVGIRSGFIGLMGIIYLVYSLVLNARRHKKWFHVRDSTIKIWDFMCSTPVGIRSGFIT